jgi:HTH-type transcriptional regulator/antitoxin HigA
MDNIIQNQYTPDYVSPPGETLSEIIEELGMSQAELARRMGRPKKTINEIVWGKAAITPQTSLQFERVLGTPASFWNTREQQYRQHLARIEEEKRLSKQVDWLQKFPVKAMSEKGWIRIFDDKMQQLHELLIFFGVALPEQWDACWSKSGVVFRKTTAFASSREALSAWLRRGEIEAQGIYCQPYAAETFRQTLIDQIRPLTLTPPDVFQPKLVRLCAQAGVAVVFVPQLSQARVSGATRWLKPNKALIQLSLRYKTDDHLWFTFFHEAGHILLHGKRDVFLEDDAVTDAKEQQANTFAANILIPPARLRGFLAQPKSVYGSKIGIRAFASEIGIAPGIVVGRLQHDKHLSPANCNDLKQRLAWAD